MRVGMTLLGRQGGMGMCGRCPASVGGQSTKDSSGQRRREDHQALLEGQSQLWDSEGSKLLELRMKGEGK